MSLIYQFVMEILHQEEGIMFVPSTLYSKLPLLIYFYFVYYPVALSHRFIMEILYREEEIMFIYAWMGEWPKFFIIWAASSAGMGRREDGRWEGRNGG